MKGLFSAVKGILNKLGRERARGGEPLPPKPDKPHTFPPRGQDPRFTVLPREIESGPIIVDIQNIPDWLPNYVPNVELDKASIENFLYFGQWLNVISSNVRRIKYDADPTTGFQGAGLQQPTHITSHPSRGRLEVQFIGHGSRYEYNGVSNEVAYDFATAISKGKWVWDHLRSAGVPYAFIGSDDGHVPERLNPGSRKSMKRLKATLVRRARIEAKKPRFAKVKVRKSLHQIVKKIVKQRAGG